jgi:hypothetical protein
MMEIDGNEVVKNCRHCKAFIKPTDKICPLCKKETAYPILEKYDKLNFDEIKEKINNSFYLLECFMQGRIEDYQYFGFNDAFTKLFIEARKPENFTYSNCKLIGEYWKLTEQIRVDYDQSEFENSEASENEMFCNDCNEIMYLNWERSDEFVALATTDEIAEAERKFSITDLLKAPTLPPQQTETKSNKLKAELGKYGFFELKKVKQLSEPNKQNLVELINTEGLPYSIAMFEYLAFLKHLKAEHLTTDYKLFKAISEWFDVSERAVKGNIYVLNQFSEENRKRYTADQHKQIVQNDYEKLK